MTVLKKIVPGLLWAIGSLFLLLLIASAIVNALGIQVELNSLRTPVEIAFEKATGRKVHFRGDLSLVPTLWPTLEIQQVQIDNPPNWQQGVFADADLIRIQLGLFPLLKGGIHLGEVTVNGIIINLLNNQQGRPNWLFSTAEEEPQQTLEVNKDEDAFISFAALNELALEDITLNYQDQKLNRRFSFRLDKMKGSILPEQPFKLDIEGYLEKKHYKLQLAGGSLSDLRDRTMNWPVHIKADIAGTPINLEGQLVRENEPELHAKLTIGHVDIGATLAWLKIASDIEASTDALTVKTELRGESLSELLALSKFNLTVDQTVWTLTDANTQAQLPIMIKHGQLAIKPEQPVLLTLDSQIDKEPVLINIKGSKLADYWVANKQYPLQIKVQGMGADLTLKSLFSLPVSKKKLSFSVDLKGESLDSFNQLFNVDLPPIGPYSLKGWGAVTPEGYSIKDLLLQVGSSHLLGNLVLAMTETPPRLEVQLESKRIQINDFDLQGWSSAGEEGADLLASSDVKGQDKQAEQKSQQARKEKVRKLLSPKVFQSLAANIDIQAKEVLSGSDVLGKGQLLLILEQGRLSLQRSLIEVPGGSAELQAEIYPTSENIEVSLSAKIDKFDYGILARRIDKKSETFGMLSLDIGLTSKVKEIKDLLANGSGHFDFGVLPGDMDADVFDLWAVNLLSAIVSRTDKDSHSRVNCVVASFDLNDGFMQQKMLFADTSKMQIEGQAEVNFKSREIKLYVAPKAKKAEFFSLATPVKVTGSFEDFGIGINPAQLAGSVLNFVVSPVFVPVDRLISKSAAADGKEACAFAWKMRNTTQKDTKK